jgi:hypothetical protein
LGSQELPQLDTSRPASSDLFGVHRGELLGIGDSVLHDYVHGQYLRRVISPTVRLPGTTSKLASTLAVRAREGLKCRA